LKTELTPASGNSFYRTFRDETNQAVFAYELEVTRAAGRDEFRIVAKPAGTEFASRFPDADGGKPVPTLSAAREFAALRSGQQAEIGLFEIPGRTQSIIDTVQVILSETGAAKAQPADRLQFAGLKVYVNGTLVSSAAGDSAAENTAVRDAFVSGRYTMFYVPGRGGYFFAAGAVDGRSFVIAGSIDRNRMQFTIDNEAYNCTADAPILVHSERGEVWVYHDAAYKPEGDWTTSGAPAQVAQDVFFAAGSDSLNWWLP